MGILYYNFNPDYLAKALETNKSIRYLRLRICGWNSQNVTSLVKALDKSKTVTYLDLAHNDIDPNAAADFLKNPTLTYLNLSSNPQYSGLNKLTEALKTNTTLKVLKLNGIDRLKPKKARELIKVALTDNQTLRVLELINHYPLYPHKNDPLKLSELMKEVFPIPLKSKPARLPLLVLVNASRNPTEDLLSYGDNQVVWQACLNHAKQLQEAYATGKILRETNHLNQDVTLNIVADYLGLKGEQFQNGFTGKQPAPQMPSSEMPELEAATTRRYPLNDLKQDK